jgi:hypothetical protein
MAITNLYPNLPGHLVEFKDGGMQLRETAVTGNSKSLLILGTAIDGPVNEPVAIDVENVQKLFGDDVNSNGVPNGATLTKYARQAYKAGFNDIRCMRVTGSSASATIETNSSTVTELQEFISEFNAKGNKKYTVTLDMSSVPSGKYGAIKKEDIAIIHPTAGSEIANTFNIPNEVVISANQVPARGDITIDYKIQVVDPSTLTSKDTDEEINSLLLDADTNTWNVKAPFTITDMYMYNLDGLTPGAATTDNHGVPVAADNLVAITTVAGEIYYATLILKDVDGNTKTIENATLDTNNVLTVECTEIADPAEMATKTTYTLEYIAYTEIESSTVVSQDALYVPQEITLDDDKIPVTGEEIYLYDSTGANVVSKLSDANGVLTYDSTTNKVIVDLSKVPNVIPLGYITMGALLKVVYNYETTTTVTESITFRSIYGGEVYNEASVAVDLITDEAGNAGRLITLTKPSSKRYSDSEAALAFSSFDYPTFGLLRDAIANHSLNNVFEAVTDYEDAPTDSIPVGNENSIVVNFTGGTSGVSPTNDEMFVALSGKRNSEGYLTERGAYQVLENYNVDYIYVAGVYADSKVSPSISKNSFHYELALLCAVLTYRTKMVHGYIDVKPNTNTTLIGIQNYVEKLLTYDNTHYMKDNDGNIIYDENNNPMDIGWYTSAVVGPEPICVSPTLGNYYGSPAIAYAALNANLKAQSAPTNKSLPGCTGMRYKFSNKQLNELTANRFVTFKLKNEGVTNSSKIPYVVDGCTCGASTSDYARITTVKVVTRCVDEVREVADPFIGEPNTVEQRNALAALISKRLTYLKDQGVIQYFEFEISATVEQVLIGECSIALTLVAPQELRKITTVVALRATA